MPFNGSGVFEATASSFNPAVDATEIDSSDWNDLLTEIEVALTKAICKDGQSTTSAEITFAVGIKVNNTGLKVLDTNASHTLAITPGSNLTANRIFTLTTGDAARTLDMSAGDLTAGGGQYVFPASQNASADANTLDDYEEGTFTPGVSFGGGTTGLTYTLQDGSYEKVGRNVQIRGIVRINDNGSSSGAAFITGLPFTAASGNEGASAIALFGESMSGVDGHLQSYVVNNTTTANIVELVSGTQAALTETNLPNSSGLVFGGHYRV